jgi:hypothetical protein
MIWKMEGRTESPQSIFVEPEMNRKSSQKDKRRERHVIDIFILFGLFSPYFSIL